MRSGCVLATLGLVLLVLGGATTRASLARRVSASLVFWDQARGFDTIVSNPDLFSEISPFWYRVAADGSVVPYVTASGASYEDPAILSFLRASGILVIPTVANVLDGVWDGSLVSGILADPARSAANIGSLVRLAVDNGYDGIDLDYENLAASDRSAFTTFVSQLAAALHAQNKLLTVNVYAKTAEPGSWSGPQAQDYAAIGQAADEVRIMTYEYHWSTSAPGPIAPIDWVADVLSFARTSIPSAKIIQGVPLYGYDWVGQSGVDHVWQETTNIAAQYNATINWDGASASPWFEYLIRHTRHTVWFENGASSDAKLELNGSYDVGGISVWRLGGEDPLTWGAVRSRWGGGGGGGAIDTVPPTVALASPLDGAQLERKQRIEALAADNIGVARVEFYVNGVLLASDTAAPYVVSWNTRRLSAGGYVVQAVAYDSSGNSATATATTYR
jgi:spore germination protein YaaH